MQLSAGTFTLNNQVLISKGITLRGAGSGRTILRKTNGAILGDYHSQDTQPIIIIDPVRWEHPNDAKPHTHWWQQRRD